MNSLIIKIPTPKGCKTANYIGHLEFVEIDEMNSEIESEQDSSAIYLNFGSRCKELWKKHGMTKEELVEVFVREVNRPFIKGAISNHENRKRIPRVLLFVEFAKSLGVIVETPLGADGDKDG